MSNFKSTRIKEEKSMENLVTPRESSKELKNKKRRKARAAKKKKKRRDYITSLYNYIYNYV